MVINKENIKELTTEYLSDLNNLESLYMNNSMIYALEQEKVCAINKLLSSPYQDMEFLKKIVENYFHITVIIPIVENPELNVDIISYIIKNIENIELPTNPIWIKSNKNPKEYFEMIILDSLYLHKNTNEDLKKVLNQKCSSFFVERSLIDKKIKIIKDITKINSNNDYINKRFVTYKGQVFLGFSDGLMGLESDVENLFAIGFKGNDFSIKAIPKGFLDDTQIHQYNKERLHLIISNLFSDRKFIYISNEKNIIIDERDILDIKLAISNNLQEIKKYNLKKEDKHYHVHGEEFSFVFDDKKNKIIGIL